MENVKEKLTTILREHGRLSSQHYLEENNMNKRTRLKEQDMADKDVQAPAKSSADAAPKNPLLPDASQNQNEIQAESENGDGKDKMKEADMADKDVQAPATIDASKAKTPPLDDQASQNTGEIQKENAEEDEMQENAEEDKPMAERFREMEDDMYKVVDVVEALKNQVDELTKKVEALSAGEETPAEQAPAEPAAPPEQAPADEQPMAPHTESAILRGAFAESVADVAEKQKIGQALGRLIRG